MKRKPQDIEPSHIVQNANEFFEIALKCIPTTKKQEYLLVPQFVNLAFACELYIKAIAQHETKSFAHGRDLKQLYDGLSKPTKEAIAAEFLAAKKVSAEESYKRQVKSIGFSIKPRFNNDPDAPAAEIEFMLPSIANTFPEWRYIFQQIDNLPGICSSFFYDFATALKEYAEKTIPYKSIYD